MNVQKVRIRFNELSTRTLTVPAWEVPILAAVHGDADVTVVAEEHIDREPPDPQDEYTRLEDRYPGKEGGAPPVAQVYGQHSTGVQRLAAAIAQASKAAPRAATPKSAASGSRAVA